MNHFLFYFFISKLSFFFCHEYIHLQGCYMRHAATIYHNKSYVHRLQSSINVGSILKEGEGVCVLSQQNSFSAKCLSPGSNAYVLWTCWNENNIMIDLINKKTRNIYICYVFSFQLCYMSRTFNSLWIHVKPDHIDFSVWIKV